MVPHPSTPSPAGLADRAFGLAADGDAGVEALLARHHALMRSLSPEESCHVLTAAALREGGARVYALRDGAGTVCAVGALMPFDADAVELKSMHVAAEGRGTGLGRLLLAHMLDAARACGARSAWLETGSAEEFAAARALYVGAGFRPCAPFGAYCPDPLSVFMTRTL